MVTNGLNDDFDMNLSDINLPDIFDIEDDDELELKNGKVVTKTKDYFPDALDLLKEEDVQEEEVDETEVEDEVEEEEIEESSEAEYSSGDESLIDITNELQEEGLIPFDIDSLPEDVDINNFKQKDFMNLIRASVQKNREDAVKETQKATFDAILGRMPNVLQRAFDYSLHGVEEEEVKDYMKALLYEQDIKSLDPSDVDDAERIVDEWYKEQGFDLQNRQKRITKLKERGELEDEAQLYKPKLDQKAEEIANAKVQTQNEIKEIEEKRKSDLERRIRQIYESNTKDGVIYVKDLPVDRELAGFLYTALLNDTVPVQIKGKSVDLTVSEAIVLHHKYNQSGDLENLMRALILLHKPEVFEQHYKKAIKKEETEKFIKDHRISSQKKAGLIPSKKERTNNSGMSFTSK